MLAIIIKFIREQWFGSGILVLLLVFTIYNQVSEKSLQKKETKIENKIFNLTKDKEVVVKKIDSLLQIDTKFVKQIKQIKQKNDEKIKVVDNLNVSGLQKFFSDRYPE